MRCGLFYELGRVWVSFYGGREMNRRSLIGFALLGLMAWVHSPPLTRAAERNEKSRTSSRPLARPLESKFAEDEFWLQLQSDSKKIPPAPKNCNNKESWKVGYDQAVSGDFVYQFNSSNERNGTLSCRDFREQHAQAKNLKCCLSGFLAGQAVVFNSLATTLKQPSKCLFAFRTMAQESEKLCLEEKAGTLPNNQCVQPNFVALGVDEEVRPLCQSLGFYAGLARCKNGGKLSAELKRSYNRVGLPLTQRNWKNVFGDEPSNQSSAERSSSKSEKAQ